MIILIKIGTVRKICKMRCATPFCVAVLDLLDTCVAKSLVCNLVDILCEGKSLFSGI